MNEILDTLTSIEQDSTVPRNIREKIKDTIIDSYKEAFPDNFKFIVKDMTWDSAMEDLTTFIKNQKGTK